MCVSGVRNTLVLSRVLLLDLPRCKRGKQTCWKAKETYE